MTNLNVLNEITDKLGEQKAFELLEKLTTLALVSKSYKSEYYGDVSTDDLYTLNRCFVKCIKSKPNTRQLDLFRPSDENNIDNINGLLGGTGVASSDID